MIPYGSVASATDGFDQVVGWDAKVDNGTHWLYLWGGGQDKTLTVVRGLRTPIEILVVGGGGGGNNAGYGGSAGGLVHKTNWTFSKKGVWTIPYCGIAGGSGANATKTRLQNAANTAYIECGGGLAGGVSSTSGTTSVVYENGTVSSGYGGHATSSGGAGCIAGAAGDNGGQGYQVSWWSGIWLGAGGGGYVGWGYGQPTGGGNGTFGGGYPPTDANAFAYGSGGGAGNSGSGYPTGGTGAVGAIFVRIPKVLA